MKVVTPALAGGGAAVRAVAAGMYKLEAKDRLEGVQDVTAILGLDLPSNGYELKWLLSAGRSGSRCRPQI